MDVEKDISCIFGVFTKIWYLRREIDSDDQYHQNHFHLGSGLNIYIYYSLEYVKNIEWQNTNDDP